MSVAWLAVELVEMVSGRRVVAVLMEELSL